MAKDKELIEVVGIIGIFGIALIVVDILYFRPSMFNKPDLWVGLIWSALHAIAVVAWLIVVKYWRDPNIDFFRWILIIVQIAALTVTLSYRNGLLNKVGPASNANTKCETHAFSKSV